MPAQLRGRPGIGFDSKAADAAFVEAPLPDWSALHADGVRWFRRKDWRSFLICTPRLRRAGRFADRVDTMVVDESAAPTAVDTRALTAAFTAKAAAIGISAVGIAQYDRRYTFEPAQRNAFDDRVVVCVLEQNWAATQTAPSAQLLKASLVADARLTELAALLTQWLHGQGYRARLHEQPGETMLLNYAVAAGLGQMGMNGQVLTPRAGSRCRLVGLTTNAPLDFDKPIDYGIEKLCDNCQVCVRRCPSGAIQTRRVVDRGVEKSKINTARCFPVVVQTHGCGICIKVCPVQRYGLDAVMKEYEASGRILGKDTEELEGYWFDDVHYASGRRPHLREAWFHPEGFTFDAQRKMARPTGRDAAEV